MSSPGAIAPSRGSDPSGATAADPSPSRGSDPSGEGGAAVTLTQWDIYAVLAALQKVTVAPSKREYVVGRSEAVGWTDFRRAKGVSIISKSERYVHLQLVVNELIARCFPGFVWTSLMVNHNTNAAPHKDKGNVGNSVAIIIMPEAVKEGEGLLVYTDGDEYLVVGRPGQAVLFTGHREHANTPYDGVRYSIVAFRHKSFDRAAGAARQELESLGYQLPAAPSRGSDPSGAATGPSPPRGSDPSGEGPADDDGDADEDVWGDDEVAPTVHSPTSVTTYNVYHITVRCVPDGLEVDVPVYQGMPVEGLNMKLKEIFGIAENDQLIAYCGEYLQDGKLIGDYFVEDGWAQVAFLATK